MAATHIILLILICCCCDHVLASNKTIIRGVYYPSWATTLKPSNINTNYFTHIYYAFLNPSNVTFKFNITTEEATFLRLFNKALHERNPPAKTLFSIGGWGASLFPAMTSNQRNRKAFIDSCIDVARTYGFDGFDLDYEYSNSTKEMDNLSLLLNEWRAAVQTEAQQKPQPPLLITAAVYYSATLQSGLKYQADAIKRNLDWINVMNYDYHGWWEKTATGAHAALFDQKTNVSTYYGIGSWVDAGVPSEMVMMGMPMYARTWRLKNPAQAQGVGAQAVGVGPGDPDGTMAYADVVKWNSAHKVKGVFDKATVSEYSVANKSWIGYDGPTTVGAKVVYARALDLGGYFFWSAHQDYNWELAKAAFDFW